MRNTLDVTFIVYFPHLFKKEYANFTEIIICFFFQVCGFNGRTYNSECAAHADLVSVDYESPCSAIGLITNTKSKQCFHVVCPKLSDPFCLGMKTVIKYHY